MYIDKLLEICTSLDLGALGDVTTLSENSVDLGAAKDLSKISLVHQYTSAIT